MYEHTRSETSEHVDREARMAEISRERPELKYYWSRWEQLKLEDGIWYYRWNRRIEVEVLSGK